MALKACQAQGLQFPGEPEPVTAAAFNRIFKELSPTKAKTWANLHGRAGVMTLSKGFRNQKHKPTDGFLVWIQVLGIEIDVNF